MIHHRELSEVRRFDLFKLLVLIVLLALLLWFWLSPPAFVRGPVSSSSNGSENTAAITTDGSTAVEAVAVEDPAPDSEAAPLPQIVAPQLAAPLPAEGLAVGSHTLRGSGTPGATVQIVVDGEAVGTTAVGEDGTWSFDLDLAAGTRQLSLEALNPDGSLAASTDLPPVDVVEPAPFLAMPTLDFPGADLPAGPLTLTGEGTPGSSVGVVVNGEAVGTTAVDDDGRWSLAVDLPAGTHTLRVQALDASGSPVQESETVALSLSAVPEIVLPSFTLPSPGQAGGEIALTGSGSPGSEVEIVVNGQPVGTAVVADDGTWAFPTTLPAGEYELMLRTDDGTGAVAETEPFAFTLPLAPPVLVTPADGAEVASGALSLTGTGEPGQEIEIVDGETVVGTAVVAEDGTWLFSYTPSAGSHSYSVRNAGTGESSSPSSIHMAAPALPADYCRDVEPGIDQGDSYVVGVCEWLVKIANRLGIPYSDLIGVNTQIENPNLIYPGQVINLPPR